MNNAKDIDNRSYTEMMAYYEDRIRALYNRIKQLELENEQISSTLLEVQLDHARLNALVNGEKQS